jgi:dihydropteroate synthase
MGLAMGTKDTTFLMNQDRAKSVLNSDRSDAQVMAILNLTPDSFHPESRIDPKSLSTQQMVDRAGDLIQQGAHLLDLGAQSTRPGAELVLADEEAERLLPGLEAIRQAFPAIPISVDTFWASVARQAIDLGADIINDISAGSMDPDLIPTVGSKGAGYILMHMQGQPQSMQQAPTYQDVVQEVGEFLQQGIDTCQQAGIEQLAIDPGFGFGKTLTHNYSLLMGLSQLKRFNLPIVVGLSRKSMITRLLEVEPKDALNGTSVLHALALQQGATILRVHDVEPAMEVIAIMNKYHDAAL